MHTTTVVRQDGRYRVLCEECGEVASSQTQKAVMETRAALHRETGATTLREHRRAASPARPVLRAEPAPLRQDTCNRCNEPLGREHWHTTAYPVREICCACAGHVLT